MREPDQSRAPTETVCAMNTVAVAAERAAYLEDRAFRRGGWHRTRASARDDVARQTGASASLLKRLRLGPSYWPKDIMASAFEGIRVAYERECERVEAMADRLEGKIEATECLECVDAIDEGVGACGVGLGASGATPKPRPTVDTSRQPNP